MARYKTAWLYLGTGNGEYEEAVEWNNRLNVGGMTQVDTVPMVSDTTPMGFTGHEQLDMVAPQTAPILGPIKMGADGVKLITTEDLANEIMKIAVGSLAGPLSKSAALSRNKNLSIANQQRAEILGGKVVEESIFGE